jgi:hypothetical protein
MATRAGLVPELPPMFVSGPATTALAERLATLVSDLPPGLGRDVAAWYLRAARAESDVRAGEAWPDATNDSTRLLRDVVISRAGESSERAEARARLAAGRAREGVSWMDAWALLATGRSLLREETGTERRRGAIELLRFVSVHQAAMPELSEHALALAAVTLQTLGDGPASAAVRRDLERRFPDSAMLAMSGSAAQQAAVDVHAEHQTPPREDAGEFETFLDHLGPGAASLIVTELEDLYAAAPRAFRRSIAERLAHRYVALLESETDAERAAGIEAQARTLLDREPDIDSFELRIHLERAIYLKAEQAVEKHRLRLGTAEDAQQAQTWLTGLEGQFRQLGTKLNQRVMSLEREEASGGGTSGIEKLQADLAEARRLRSLAFYYAGWTKVYLATLTGDSSTASEALRDFGWLLNGQGQRAVVAKMQLSLLQYPHVCRAVIGSALASALAKQDAEATRWLDVLAASDRVPPDIASGLPRWRLVVLGSSGRWADALRVATRTRRTNNPDGSRSTVPLATTMARLLAVHVLESPATDATLAGVQYELLKLSLDDLISQRELAQVLDLVKRYGTLPLGAEGFVPAFVRGLYAFDQARTRHIAETGGEAGEPSTSPEVINAYQASAALLTTALAGSDAANFAAERVRASMTLARATFFAGDLAGAARLFFQAHQLGASEPSAAADAEDALWLAIIATDRMARGSLSAGAAADTTRRGELIALFLSLYPTSERSPRLMVMQASSGEINPDDAIRMLSEVPTSSPDYLASRRQLAQLLYQRVRPGVRDVSAFDLTRFLAVAEEVLAIDLALTTGESVDERRRAADRAVARSRQLAEVLLSSDTPDVQRAGSLLDQLDQLLASQRIDATGFAAELAFRRVQLALARGDETTAEQVAERLSLLPDRGASFGAAADRLLYRRAWAAWTTTDTDARTIERAASLVGPGLRLLDRSERSAGSAPAGEVAARLTISSGVAEAAWWLFEATGAERQRNLAMRLDAIVLQTQPGNAASLGRLGAGSMLTGDFLAALRCFATLSEAQASGTPEWFAWRSQWLIALSKLDRSKARAALDQHRALYPELGPEPWRTKLQELDASLAAPAQGPITPGNPAKDGPKP